MRGRLAGASGHVDDGLCEEGVGAAEGVCVAGSARFFGCVGGQNGFLVFLGFIYVVFFVNSTEVMIFWS